MVTGFLGFLVLIFLSDIHLSGQTAALYQAYIEKYTDLAIREMHYSKIPASVTMAQALLESQFGTSELAVNANNHFGIKCQTGWSGETYTYQDDDDNTCFRKYTSVEESYRDHSHFLMYRPRYAALFELDPYDYTAWAHGLKKAGYATNPNYAPMLLRIIEEYNLKLLDSMPLRMEAVTASDTELIPVKKRVVSPSQPRPLHRNRIEYTVAKPGDSVSLLTEKYDKLRWEIRKYNEIPRGGEIEPGQVVYLQPKRKQAEPGYTFHTVQEGETMHSISQMYGIRLKWLYKRNRMVPGTEPRVGEEIWLRGKKPNRR
jgi:LysM repeat protein